MYGGFQQIIERFVDQPVTGERLQPREGRGDDAHAKMPAPVGGADVPDVPVGFVDDLERHGGEAPLERLAQAPHALARAHGRRGHGEAASEDRARVLPLSHSTCGSMNSSIAIMMPNTLKLTHTPSAKLWATYRFARA